MASAKERDWLVDRTDCIIVSIGREDRMLEGDNSTTAIARLGCGMHVCIYEEKMPRHFNA